MIQYYGQANQMKGKKNSPQSLQPNLVKCVSKFGIRSTVFCIVLQWPDITLRASVRLARLQQWRRETTRGFTALVAVHKGKDAATGLIFLQLSKARKKKKKNRSNAMENITSAATFNSIWINLPAKLKLHSLWSFPILTFSWAPHYLEIKGNAKKLLKFKLLVHPQKCSGFRIWLMHKGKEFTALFHKYIEWLS